MPTLDVNGVSLAYEESGTGPPVVLVHGGVSDHRIWEAQRRALGRSRRAIAYSCRYHWPNARATAADRHAVTDHVEDLAGLVRALDAAPAHFVGNSFGGLLCLLVALHAPGLVRSLVLLEPFAMPFFVGVPPKPGALFALALRDPVTAAAILHFGARGLGPAQAAFSRGDLEGGLDRFIRAVLGASGIARMTQARRDQAQDNVETFAVQLTQGTFPSLRAEDLRRVGVPTLLLSGEESPWLMRRLTDRVQGLVPECERIDVPQASHDLHVDAPEAVTAAIEGFLARVERKT